MKKNKKLLLTLSIFIGLILCNLGYYVITNFKSFFKSKTSSSLTSITSDFKTYDSAKDGFSLHYPASWIVKESEDAIEIKPSSEDNRVYFTITLRQEFTSLDDIKSKLAKDILLTSIEIGGASGFKYRDSDSHDSIWLSHSGKIYIVRTYPMNNEANQILSTLTFKD